LADIYTHLRDVITVIATASVTT